MATTIYMLDTAATTHRGTNSTNLLGAAVGWLPKGTSTSRGSGLTTTTTNTATGPTNGLEVTASAGGTRLEWLTPPIDQDVTIEGSISFNAWAAESNMSANAGMGVYVDKVAAATGTLTRITQLAPPGEMAVTTRGATGSSGSVTSTACNKGDRLRIVWFVDDGGGTLASGYTVSMGYNGTTAAADGDTYLSFTETFGFQEWGGAGAAIVTQDTSSTSALLVGSGAGTIGIGQGFTLGSSASIAAVDQWLAKNSSPTDNLVLDIVSTLTGSSLGQATVAGSSLSTTASHVRFTFASPVSLTAGSYFLRFTRSGAADGTNRYELFHSTSNPYAGGSRWIEGSPGSWTEGSANDLRFIIYEAAATGSTVYLTDTASDVATANVDREAWTSRGGSAANDVTNTSAGWTAPVQVTDTAGGTAVSWFTKPLEAFTLSGLVKVNRRVLESNAAANASVGVELARVDEDGTNATVWGYANRDAATTSGSAGEIALSETAYTCYVAGDDLAFTDGQRIRIRLFHDDCADVPLVTAHTLTSYYGGPTGGASGDTYLILGQTLTEYAGGGGATVTPATIARSITVPQVVQTTTASVTPATVSRSVTIDQASAGAATSQTPATIARAVTVPQAEARAGVSVTPATIARSITVPAASPQLGTSVTPVTVSRAVSVPQSAGGAFASVTPATIARAVTTPQASPQAGASVTPILGGRSVLVPQAGPIASSSVTPATIARSVAMPQADATGGGAGAEGPAMAGLVWLWQGVEAVGDAYEDEVTADAPVVWWKANDASGALEDHGSGADSDIAVFGDPVYWETSLVSVGTNTAVKFNSIGSNDYFRTAMTSELQLSGSFTFEVWFRYTGSPGSLGTIMCERFDDTTDVRYAMTFNDGSTNTLKPSFGWFNGSWRLATGGSNLVTNTTYHLVGVYDASGTPSIMLYVNGSLVDTETSIGTQPTGTNDVQLGRRWDSSSAEYIGGTADCWIQHAAFYGTALSGARIAAHYAAGAGGVGATVTPATIARSVVIPQASPQLGATVTPATVARAITVNAPTVSTGAGATVTPATITRSVTIPQASPQLGTTASPAVIARSVTIDGPTVNTGAGASVTPATVARSITIPLATQQLGTSITPAVIARSVAIPQTGYAIGASLTPVTIGRAITVNAPIVTAGGGATRTPDTLAAVVAIGQVVAQVGSVITPATIARSVLVPQAGPLASSTLTPATIARAVAMGTPTVTTQVSVTPVTISRSVLIDQVTPLLSAVASPAVIARSVSVPQAAIAAGASVTPATVARAVAMGTPTVVAGGDVTLVPDTIVRAFSVPQASPQAAASITPATVARSLSVPQVAATGASTVSPALIARSVAMGQVIITAAASITPATLARAFVIDQAIGGASKTVSPALIARAVTMPQTTTQVGTDANPVIAVIARAFTIPGTGYVTNWVVSATSIALVVTINEPDIITKPTLIITRSGPKAPGPATGEVLVTGDGAGTPTPAGDVLVISG